ncbi:hypothetical protein C0W92_02545 [Photobacterium angustum]|uniref:Uncharacterized protein n=1 Tax=Photobacterium angustum TaxID=661 RepID=A0A855SF68_PHOAN|nr:hypothetical protein [Photobacterium angustum]KJG17447.1 hypothetical protein UA33_09110 [Photobacterium angustum]KJG23915.1 hypothetical protein UA39_09660 [Photobacterium angustum]KJG31401.1 hypothetical protein UA36_09870 [Photobacterium angustum]KJG31608.1 hypothetical protein UA69_08215 [Photobacterium angustum]PSV94507.1 hypothetical protein CTN01_08320 [Photobacterium angustum]
MSQLYNEKVFVAFLFLSFTGLAGALFFVGEKTYDIDSVAGEVTETFSKFETGERELVLKVIPEDSEKAVSVPIKSSVFCPVGSDVILFKKECKLFGPTEYELISCGCDINTY